MTTTAQQTKTDTISPRLMTVADIAESKDERGNYVVTFYESARFYTLPGKNKHCDQSLKLLKQSKKMNQPVEVYLTEKLGDIIDHVRKFRK